MHPLVLVLLATGEPGVVDSREFTQAVQRAALASTVRIVNTTRQAEGSGVILKASGPFVYILTAGHVVEKGDTLEIATFSVRSYPRPETLYRSGEVLARALTPDLAVIRLATRDTMPGAARLCPLARMPEGKSLSALSVGCESGKAPTCSINSRIGKRRVVKPGERDGCLCWEAPTAQAKGRSGGPLLDRQGRLIGLASGIGDGKGYYTHIEEVHRFLKRNGLKWLGE